ncbi:hypothetical protein HY491_02030 [Candidatus Woesearchaeota archaeon]|nr:hypothetical protein [Candidatus Woesearchaeota archaeon]
MAELFQNNKPAPDDYFLQKQIEVLLDISSKKVMQELAVLKGMVGKLSEELGELKARERRAAPVEHQQQTTATAAPVSTPSQRQEQPVQQRYGNVKPEEVAIDKFFYFGNKR